MRLSVRAIRFRPLFVTNKQILKTVTCAREHCFGCSKVKAIEISVYSAKGKESDFLNVTAGSVFRVRTVLYIFSSVYVFGGFYLRDVENFL